MARAVKTMVGLVEVEVLNMRASGTHRVEYRTLLDANIVYVRLDTQIIEPQFVAIIYPLAACGQHPGQTVLAIEELEYNRQTLRIDTLVTLGNRLAEDLAQRRD